MKKENYNEKNKKIIIIILIFIILLLLIGITFAWFRFKDFSDHTNSLTTGKIEVRLDEYDGKTIELVNTYPMTDASGQATKPYEFSLVSRSSYNFNYDVKLVLDEKAVERCGCKDNLIDDSMIRYELKRGGTYQLIDTLSNYNDWIIDNNKLLSNSTVDYSLRLWLYEKAGNEYMGKHFHAKIQVRVVEDK